MRIAMISSLLFSVWAVPALAFVPSGPRFGVASTKPSTILFSSADNVQAGLLSITLEKPLGMLLEEMEEGAPLGVKVEDLADSGSAYASQYKDQLVGLKVATVMGEDVTAFSFDDVMEKIIDAPSPVTIEFEVEASQEAAAGDAEQTVSFDVGTPVAIKVIQEGNPDREINARVGDNLRKTLLENDVELYRGLKKKLGNCGGSGQCTFCAVDFKDSEGWEERSEYEDGRLKKAPNARLACLNNIQGPATIRVQ
mmetsp:Transcript_27797/g.39104  ORF Transcript_27797/g.39104 Transcript_27797/m.39104 type:complete len:253 (+) Transcript_27797:79-837(+)